MSIAEDLDPQRANQFCVLHCCSFSIWNTTSTDFSVATLSPIFRKKECVYSQRGSITQKYPKSSDILFFFKQGGDEGVEGSSCYFSGKRGVRLKSSLEVLGKWDTICFMILSFPWPSVSYWHTVSQTYCCLRWWLVNENKEQKNAAEEQQKMWRIQVHFQFYYLDAA